MFSSDMLSLFGKGILETFYMVLVSSAMAYVLGLPLGILLVCTDKNGITPNKLVNVLLGIVVNFFRSVPFVILMLWMLPVTRFIVGTTLGSTAVIVPLVVGATPFVARMIESSLKEVDHGVVEAAQSMGATTWQIITRVLLPEAKPSLLVGCAITITTILGYSAMSGFVGGGGLGDIAVRYGYYRYNNDVMTITVILLVIIVQIFQEVGMSLTRKVDKRSK